MHTFYSFDSTLTCALTKLFLSSDFSDYKFETKEPEHERCILIKPKAVDLINPLVPENCSEGQYYMRSQGWVWDLVIYKLNYLAKECWAAVIVIPHMPALLFVFMLPLYAGFGCILHIFPTHPLTEICLFRELLQAIIYICFFFYLMSFPCCNEEMHTQMLIDNTFA